MNQTITNENPILRADLLHIAETFCFHNEFTNRSILVTGATGLVGSVSVKALACINALCGTNIQIFAHVRSEEKARRVFGELLDLGTVKLVLGDIANPLQLEQPVDYIIHTASATASKFFVTKPVETLTSSIEGTRNILEFAWKHKTKSMVYLSSMEAYGITNPTLEMVKESDLGYIDILNVRSSYSEGKRACECLCAAYCAEYGVPVKIARLAQTFGPGVGREDNRVFAQFTRSCMEGKDIVLHTSGQSMGNYCYTADVVRALLTLLCRGNDGEAYTVVNEKTTMRIREVARLVSDTLTEGKTKIIFDIPDSNLTYGYAPDVTMRLTSEKLRLLGWEPEVDLPEMFRRLADSFAADQ